MKNWPKGGIARSFDLLFKFCDP